MADTYKVADHFDKKDPVVREIYTRLLTTLKTFGPIVEEPKKTSIHLVRASALAGVETRKDFLLLNIKADHKISSTRVEKAEQISAKRFHHRVRLTKPGDIDAELKGWLKHAYEISD